MPTASRLFGREEDNLKSEMRNFPHSFNLHNIPFYYNDLHPVDQNHQRMYKPFSATHWLALLGYPRHSVARDGRWWRQLRVRAAASSDCLLTHFQKTSSSRHQMQSIQKVAIVLGRELGSPRTVLMLMTNPLRSASLWMTERRLAPLIMSVSTFFIVFAVLRIINLLTYLLPFDLTNLSSIYDRSGTFKGDFSENLQRSGC